MTRILLFASAMLVPACAGSPPPEPAAAVVVVNPVAPRTLPAPAPPEPEPAPPPRALQEVEGPDGERMTIEDLVVGTGDAVESGDKITVHYTGRLLDGTEFDSSWKRNAPARFPIGTGALIRGWDLGVIGMRVGGRRRLVIPPSLAYGAKGRPPTIPESATLEFEIELVSIP